MSPFSEDVFREQMNTSLSLYDENPYMFNSNQVDFLEQQAKSMSLPFERNVDADDFSLVNTVNQLVSGMVEGYTTIGWAEDPANTTEAIVNRIGHLIGFAPDIIAGVMTGGATLPLSLARKTAIRGAASVFRQKLAKGVFGIPIKSIPFQISDALLKRGGGAIAKAGLDTTRFLKQGSLSRQMIKQAAHLGIASGVSAWQEGPEGIAKATAFGTIAGAAFGTIGNVVRIDKMLKHPNAYVRSAGEQAVETGAKALLGAGFTGGISTLSGEPVEVQVYEYLLGAFFGASSKPFAQAQGHAHVMKMQTTGRQIDLFKPEGVTGYENLTPDAKEYVTNFQNEMFGQNVDMLDPTTNVFIELAKATTRRMGLKPGDTVKRSDIAETLKQEGLRELENEAEIETKPEPTQPIVETQKFITRQDVKNNPDKVYLFGDNLEQRGLGGQAKSMRGEPNAYGIPTKKKPSNTVDSFFSDSELAANKLAIDMAIAKIPKDKTIVLPEDGLGTGRASLQDKAPETFNYLNQKLSELGTQPKPTKPLVPIADDPVSEKTIVQQETRDIGDPLIVINDAVDNLIPSIKEKSGESATTIQQNLQEIRQQSKGDFDEFMRLLSHYAPSVRPVNERSIKQLLLRDRYDIRTAQRSYNKTRKAASNLEDYNVQHKMVVRYAPMIEFDKKFGEGTVKTIREVVDEITYDSEGVNKTLSRVRNPLDTEYKNGKLQSILQHEDWQALEKQLAGVDEYIYGGTSDKGILLSVKFHPKTDVTNLSSFDAELKAIDPKWLEVFDLDVRLEQQRLGIFDAEGKAQVEQHTVRKWTSNILYMKDTGTLSDFKNVVDFNKRQGLLRGGEYPLDPAKMGDLLDIDSNLKYMLTKDHGNPEVDGAIVYHSKLHNNIIEQFGLWEGAGLTKPVGVQFNTSLGQLLLKGASHSGSKAWDTLMEKHGVNLVIFDSVTKTGVGAGKRKSYDYNFSKDQFNILAEKPEIYNLRPEELKINIDISEKPASRNGERFPKGISAMVTELQFSPEAVNALTDAVYKPAIEGNVEANAVVLDFLKGKKPYKTGAIDDGSGIGINPDLISERIILEEIFSKRPKSEAASDILKYIYRRGVKGEWDLAEVGEEVEHVVASIGEWNRLARMLERGDYKYSVWSDPHNLIAVEKALGNYIVARKFKPQIKYSGNAKLISNDKELLAKLGVKDDEVYFNEGRKKDRIWFQGSETILEEAFLLYNKALARSGTSKATIKSMEDDLAYLVSRVPVGSISGNRLLKFKGFTGRPGMGMLVSKKNMGYLGGADVDGDAAFYFQKLPQVVKEAYRSHRYELERNGKLRNLKDPKVLLEYGVDPNDTDYKMLHRPISVFSSFYRIKAAAGAYRGNKNMGVVTNAQQIINSVMATVHKAGGTVKLDLTGGKGTVELKLRKYAGEANVGDEARYYGINATNAAADAAELPTLKSGVEIRQIMFDKAFTAKAFDANGKARKFKYKDLEFSDFGHLLDLNSKMFSRDFTRNKAWSLSEVVEATNKYAGSGLELDGTIARIAKLSGQVDYSFDPMQHLDIAAVKLALEVANKALEGDVNRLSLINRHSLRLGSKTTARSHIHAFNDISDYVAVELIAPRGEAINREFKKVGLDSETAQVAMNDIAERVGELKDFAISQRGLGKATKAKSSYTLSESNAAIKESRDAFIADAKALGINPKVYTDYFDYYMLSPLFPQMRIAYEEFKKQEANIFKKIDALEEAGKKFTPEWVSLKNKHKKLSKDHNKTVNHTIGWQSKEIPDAVVRDYLLTRDKIFEEVTAKAEPVKEEPTIQTKASDPEPADKDIDADLNIKETITTIIPEVDLTEVAQKKYKGAKLSEANLAEIEKLSGFLAEQPQLVSDLNARFQGFTMAHEFRGRTLQTMSMKDVKTLNRYFEWVKRGGIGKARDKDGNIPVTKVHQYLLYSQWDEILLDKDITLYTDYARTVELPDGTIVQSDVKVPMSTIGAIQKYAGHAYTSMNEFVNNMKEFHSQRYQYLNTIGEDAMLLENIAFKYVERNGSPGDIPGRKQFFNKRWQEIKPEFDRLLGKGKVYKVIEEGKPRYLDALEVVELLNKDISADYKQWYDTVISATDPEAMILNKNGVIRADYISKFMRPLITGQKLPELPSFVKIRRIQYEMELNDLIKRKKAAGVWKAGTNETAWRVQWRLDNPLAGVREVKEGFYRHHGGHMETKAGSKAAQKQMRGMLSAYRKQLGTGEVALPDYMTNMIARESSPVIRKEMRADFIKQLVSEREAKYSRFIGQSLSPDGYMSETALKWVVERPKTEEDLRNIGFTQTPGSAKPRGDIPLEGYRTDTDMVAQYKDQWIRAIFNNMTAIRAKFAIDALLKNKKLGATTEQWADMAGLMVSHIMGYPSYLPEAIIGISPGKGKALRKALAGEVLSKEQTRLVEEAIDTIAKKHVELTNKSQVQRFLKHTLMSPHGKIQWLEEKSLRIVDMETGAEEGDVTRLLHREDRLKVHGTGYHLFSDKQAVKGLNWVANKLAKVKLPFGKLPLGELPTDPRVRRDVLTRMVHKFGVLEARWELITLLSHWKTSVANIIGGSENTISSAGLRHTLNARNLNYLLNNVFPGATFKVHDPKTGKLVDRKIRTWDDINRWVESLGIIDSYFVEEGSLDRTFDTANKKAWIKASIKKVSQMLKINPDLSDAEVKLNLREIAKKYKVNEYVVNKGAMFMRKSERILRRHSFLANYLNAREALSPYSYELPFDSQQLIDMGRKGVEATQFLYHSAFRSNYSNTALGKVMTRFHPFAWNSIKFRRLTYQNAKIYGFDQSSQDFKKFQRLATIDLMAFALANVFVGSIFEYGMAPPMSWLQDSAQLLFGDERERERAFFNPYPSKIFAPLMPVTPPIARYPLNLLSTIINGDFEKFSTFYVYTWFPFGRLARDLGRTIKSPAMAPDFLTGIPLHKFHRLVRDSYEKEEEATE